ncbi:MAG: YeaH/YhbH family protein [Cellvibrionaceae bacterium]
MSYIIDRRLNQKHKSTVNRQRFLRRYKQHIKKAVSDAVNKRSITDIEQGEKISIPSKDLQEPVFQQGKGGKNTRVLPGNKEFEAGDRIQRPKGGGGGGGGGQGEASDQGEGEDEFVFQISQEEFLNFMFDDLELPNLVKRQLAGTEEFKFVRAGFSNEGSPGRMNIVRTLRSAQARRIALTAGKRKKLQKIEAEIEEMKKQDDALLDHKKLNELMEKAAKLRSLINKIPFLDDFDLKYNLLAKQPIPRSKAVMFCLMDVSGSMTQDHKDMAKRFFILLYLFLQRNYDKIEVVFIRHHTAAKEVDEQEFFYSRETGGTIVSSALKLMHEVIEERYPPGEWNIYGAQASDGDNWNDDSKTCYEIITNKLLPLLQHYAYVEITPRDHQALWHEYERIHHANPDAFALQQIKGPEDIYPVFRDLFQKRSKAAAS